MKTNIKNLFFLYIILYTATCLDKLDPINYISDASLTSIEIKIYVEENQNLILSENQGTLNFISTHFDKELNILDSSDIETQTFMTSITDEENNDYNMICSISKSSNEKIILKCNLKEGAFQKGINYININDSSFIYKDYQINIIFDKNKFSIKMIEGKLFQENESNIIYLEDDDNSQPLFIGIKGTFYLITNTNDKENIFNPSDIEEKTEFNTTVIINRENNYEVACRLWKPKNKNLYVFCKLNENNLEPGNYSINLTESYFNYNEKKYTIISHLKNLTINKLERDLSFLYAEEQNINIEQGKDSYEIKFKIEEYNEEKLILLGNELGYLFLNNCSKDEKNLTCIIPKEDLEEILTIKNKKFKLMTYYYFDDQKTVLEYETVQDININQINIEKKSVYIKINKILNKNIDLFNYISYETNETDIPALYTDTFSFNFTNYNESANCILRKYKSEKYLLFNCLLPKEGTFYIGNIIQPIILNNINPKYNFIISPGYNEEIFSIKGEGYDFKFPYPKLLDFSSDNEMVIDFLMNDNNNNKPMNIRINKDSNNLECNNIGTKLKSCSVSKSHFGNKENGYYYIYYSNNLNEFIRYYELSPIQVVLPQNKEIILRIKKENNKNIIKIGKKKTIAFITNYNDNERKILTENKEIEFDNKIIDENKNEYDVKCRLWNPNDDYIRILCDLERNLNSPKENIILKEISFEYNSYNISIYSDDYIQIEQYEYEIPFLYGEKQIISIKDEIETYNLKFIIDSYYNDLLYIYGEKNNYAILDNCEISNNNKELNCKLKKESLEEILIHNNDIFKIGAMNDYIGLIQFDNILDIKINYDNVLKKDIYIRITNLTGTSSEIGTPCGYETNITDIPNLITDRYDEIFYFKKAKGKPLTLYIDFQKDNYFAPEYNSETILDNIHYKYNFRIQPSENIESIFVENYYGTDIKLTYPEQLDFTNNDSLIIKYIMTNSSLAKNIKLNPDSTSYLDCIDFEGLKRCIVPLSHFAGKENGNYYNTYHLCNNNAYSIYYDSSLIKVILPSNRIELYIKNEDNSRIILGDNGLLYFVTNYIDNVSNIFDSDIEEKTEFITKIIEDNQESHDATCRLWKPINEKIRLFCKLNNEWVIKSEYINIKDYTLHYKDYLINIVSPINYIIIKRIRNILPFLYSNEQHINIEEEKTSYEIKFNIWEYNRESLILYTSSEANFNYLKLDTCYTEGKILRCEILKEKIEEILNEKTQRLYLTFYNQFLSKPKFESVLDIIVNCYEKDKKDVFVNITELLENKVGVSDFFAFKTNVTDISNIFYSNSFFLNRKEDSEEMPFSCYMRKNSFEPLLIICFAIEEGNYSFTKTNEEEILDDININYNFRIQPIQIEANISVSGKGNYVLFNNPKILNFYTTRLVIMDFYMLGNSTSREIRLNLDSDQLSCSDLAKEDDLISKICTITARHFIGKKTGYYNIYHYNYLNESIRFYEVNPIQVILPQENEIVIRLDKNTVSLGPKGAFILKTDYDDESNLFNSSDIEEKTSFKGLFVDNERHYMANCHLWKPNNNNDIRLICEFNDDIKSEFMKLNITSFNYKDNLISVVSSDFLEIKKLDTNIAVLYSNEQEIEIDESKSEYMLSFKKVLYNNEKLILVYIDNIIKNIYLDCKGETKEVKCTIKKDNLLKVLSKSGEKFGLSQLTDSNGVMAFSEVSNIVIKYENPVKKQIDINIKKLLTQNVDKNSFFVFETNISDISPLTTNYFNIPLISNENIKCLFNKMGNEKDDKLYLMCKAEINKIYKMKISEDIIINDVSILYNFKILQNDEIYNISVSNEEGIIISYVYPETLDFSKSDSLVIKYQADYPGKLKGIKLNKDSPYLECKDKQYLKECIVPKSHFTNPGLYYTYHNNSLGELLISYELPRVKVILNDNKDNSGDSLVGIIIISVIGGLIILIFIIYLIVRCIRKRNRDMNTFSNKIDKMLSDNPRIELQPEGETLE